MPVMTRKTPIRTLYKQKLKTMHKQNQMFVDKHYPSWTNSLMYIIHVMLSIYFHEAQKGFDEGGKIWIILKFGCKTNSTAYATQGFNAAFTRLDQ